jgi:SpoVK/Ycf46/Vps4 family AAA+-type ATPase
MAIQSVRPEVEKKKTALVDAMIKQELANMMVLAKQKGKKKKKGKKGPKLVGYKYIKDSDPYDLLVQLIQHNIVKKLPPSNLKDFIGEFNYIHSMLDDIKQATYDPSMALIRQLVTEYIIFPLGSLLVRQRFPEHVRSFLFYGPEGTGKTQVVRAIAHETKSVVFDLSPINIEG